MRKTSQPAAHRANDPVDMMRQTVCEINVELARGGGMSPEPAPETDLPGLDGGVRVYEFRNEEGAWQPYEADVQTQLRSLQGDKQMRVQIGIHDYLIDLEPRRLQQDLQMAQKNIKFGKIRAVRLHPVDGGRGPKAKVKAK